MKKNGQFTKAYKNLDFLGSSDARTLRILSEYIEPRARFERYNVTDTVVFFGSARFGHSSRGPAVITGSGYSSK